MKSMTKKILFFDKPLMILGFAILTALILACISFIYAGTYESKNTQLETNLLNIRAVAGDVIKLKTIVQSKEKKQNEKTPRESSQHWNRSSKPWDLRQGQLSRWAKQKLMNLRKTTQNSNCRVQT